MLLEIRYYYLPKVEWTHFLCFLANNDIVDNLDYDSGTTQESYDRFNQIMGNIMNNCFKQVGQNGHKRNAVKNVGSLFSAVLKFANEKEVSTVKIIFESISFSKNL